MSLLLAVVTIAAWWKASSHLSSLPIDTGLKPSGRSEAARWPWPGASSQVLAPGFSRWTATQKDGTLVQLGRFDFKANPSLQFFILDQDSEDASPGDNITKYWPRGAAFFVRAINERSRYMGTAPVDPSRYERRVACWPSRTAPSSATPTRSGAPRARPSMFRRWCSAARCVTTRPTTGGPSACARAMGNSTWRTSPRAQLQKFEGGAGAACPLQAAGLSRDVQDFWLSLRQKKQDAVWSAVNSDAGDVAQMAWWNGPRQKYEMIPPR
jgi:hypothetical protein